MSSLELCGGPSGSFHIPHQTDLGRTFPKEMCTCSTGNTSSVCLGIEKYLSVNFQNPATDADESPGSNWCEHFSMQFEFNINFLNTGDFFAKSDKTACELVRL